MEQGPPIRGARMASAEWKAACERALTDAPSTSEPMLGTVRAHLGARKAACLGAFVEQPFEEGEAAYDAITDFHDGGAAIAWRADRTGCRALTDAISSPRVLLGSGRKGKAQRAFPWPHQGQAGTSREPILNSAGVRPSIW